MLTCLLIEIVNYYKKQRGEKQMELTRYPEVKNDKNFDFVNDLYQEWVPVEGFPDYSVNRDGLCKSKNGKILTGGKNGTGCRYIMLSNGKEKKKKALSHIVADAFLGGVPKGKIVKYKDGNKENNSIYNIEFVTRNDLKLIPKLEKAKTVAYNLSTGESHIYDSAAKAGEAFGISATYVRTIRNTDKPYKGWTFDTYFGEKTPDNENVFKSEDKKETKAIKKEEEKMNDTLKVAMETAKKASALKMEPEKPKFDFEELCLEMINGINVVPDGISAENRNAYMVGYAACMQMVIDKIKDQM